LGILSLAAPRTVTIADFDSYKDLEGAGLSTGGSYSRGFISGGIDVISTLDSPKPRGISVSLAPSLGTKLDVHTTASVTETKWSFNIYEVGNNLINKAKNAWDSFWDWIGGRDEKA
jgi:hypothetical protein